MARGTGLPMVPASPIRPGGVATYGFLRGLLETLDAAIAEGRPWVYADRGYFRATYGDDRTGYFRLTRDAFQHDGAGVPDPARWDALGIKLKPWRRYGRHVLVCPPGDVFANAVGGFSGQEWLEGITATLRAATNRPIVVRPKFQRDKRPLALDLDGAHALVTYMSNTAVEAVLEGVPVFCSTRCAAAAMGLNDPALIERPTYPDREDWAATLAANQWTLNEVAQGAANYLFDDVRH